jgi:UDP-N-acetylglucosamine acyltransferase
MKYIHDTAIIGPSVIIEDDVYIGPYCVIGFNPEWKGKEHNDFGVLIKSGSRLTGMVTIDSGAERQTIIGEGAYIMKHCYVGHDSILGRNVTMSAGSKIGGYCEIADGVNIGMNATVHQKMHIPKNCMIGANSFITKKSVLREGYKYAGVPVRELGENIF